MDTGQSLDAIKLTFVAGDGDYPWCLWRSFQLLTYLL